MTTPEIDGQVQRALRRLEVPEHRPGFWEEFAARLERERRLESDGSAREVGAVSHPSARVRPAPGGGDGDDVVLEREGPSTRRWPALAAAAVAAVVGAIALLPRDEAIRVPASDPTAPTSATSTTAPARAAARDAVLTWIDALAAGEMDVAWEMLGPASHDMWGSYEAFERSRSAFAEGLGLWASAEDRRVTATTVERSATGAMHVVTLAGKRRPEGMLHDDAYAVPVRETRTGKFELEPFTPRGRLGLGFVAPQAGAAPTVWDADRPVTIAVPAEHSHVALVVDGASDPVQPSPGGRTARGVELTYVPEGGWGAGRHVVTAYAAYADGTPAAVAVVFEVPGG